MSLTVGQLAKLTGLTVRALHHYDAIGLLVPSRRPESDYRLYAQADVIRLYRILTLQRLGLSLAEIGAALTRAGTSVQQLVEQQLAELDEKIAQSARLRSQLSRLHEHLKHGAEPAMSEVLTALELIATYEGRCSADELTRLLAHTNEATDEWPPLIKDVRAAMDRGVLPDSEEAQSLAGRWMRLVMLKVSGDPQLAKKLKQAFYQDPKVQARVHAESGIDVKMIDYLLDVAMRGHVGLWAKHLSARDVQRLRMQGAWLHEWLEVVAAMRSEMERGAGAETVTCKALLERWDVLLDDFAGEDADLRTKVQDALKCDPELQERWSAAPDLQEFVERVREAAR